VTRFLVTLFAAVLVAAARAPARPVGEPAPKVKVRAAAYIRVSTLKQARKGYSLSEQRRGVEEYAAARGWELEVYVERGVSGRRADDRPELQRLLRELDRFDVLIVPRLARFGRSMSDLFKLYEQLEAADVSLVSLHENFDTGTATGRLLLGVLSVLSQFEIDVLAERVAEVSEAKASEGRYPGGRFPPYGYRRAEGGGLVVVPEQAAVVARMFRQAAAGASQREITAQLNAEGITTQNGGRWTQGTTGRTLRAPVYYGGVSHKGRVVCEQGDHQPIVDRELWDRVAQLRAARDKAPGSGRGRRPAGAHLFIGGLLRCGCGAAMAPRTYPGGREVYRCSGRPDNKPGFCDQGAVLRRPIDEAVLSHFQQVGLDVEATRQAMRANIDLRLRESEAIREQAERQAQVAEDQLARVRGDYKAGKLDAADWREFRDELTVERDAATAEAEQHRARVEELVREVEESDVEANVLRLLAELRKVVAGEITDAATLDAIRAALIRLFERFELHRIESAAVQHPGLHADLLVPGGYVLVPHVRPQAVEGHVLDGLVPVLQKTALPLPESVPETLTQTA
jgi:site-specific DNA recombinase